MATDKVIQVSFGGGIISPDMYGRKDDIKYQNGLLECKNFICQPQGPIRNRPGFEFVSECGKEDSPVRLLPFTYSTGQTMVIELGHRYARFHSYGATLVNDDDTPYQINAPWDAADLFQLDYVQSGDVVTVVHQAYKPYEIRRYGARDWRIEAVTINSKLPTPTGVKAERASSASDDPNSEKYTQKYKVSCLNSDKTEESEPSEAVSCVANVYSYGTTVKISCDKMSGASYYRFYKNKGGLYGYIGDSEEPEIIDDNITPKTDTTPKRFDDVFEETAGIQSVKVTAAGSGYGDWRNGITMDGVTVPDQSWTVSGETPPELTVVVYDAENTGSGAEVKVSTTTETWETSSTHNNGNNIEGTTTKYYARTTITGITVVSPGANYTTPIVKISGVTMKSGLNYRTTTKTIEIGLKLTSGAPTVEVTDSTGSGAELAAVVANGRVTSITIRASGSGYTNPKITFRGGTGTGALATATVGSSGDYPRAVGYFEQRRIFAGLASDPQRVLMSRTGTESDYSYSLPYLSDDRISFQLASREFSAVEHIVSLTSLVLLSSSMAYRVLSNDGSAITPSSIAVKPQSNNGSSRVMPQIVGNTCVYASARGGHLRNFAFDYNAGGFISTDMCLRASHLFDYKNLLDSALQLAPIPILWYPSSDGSLLGLTYIAEQEVAAWHRHETDGRFESVACIEEGDEDHLYVVVRRDINGKVRRYVERMTSMNTQTLDDAFFVDAGGVYEGKPATKLSGLDWLEGKTVSILADGAVMPQQVVKDGKIEIGHAAKRIVVGLPIEADAETLPLSTSNVAAYGAGIKKNIYKVHLRVKNSSGVFVGPDFDSLIEYKQRTTEPMNTPPELLTGEIEVRIPPSWTIDGSICLRQSDPLPLTIQNITLTVSI